MASTQDTVYYTAWLLLHDEVFIKQHLNLRPEVFPRGSLRYLVGLSLSWWRQYHTHLTKNMVEVATQNDSAAVRKAGADKDAVPGVYVDLSIAYFLEDRDLPAMRDIANKWLDKRLMGVAIEAADRALQSDKPDEARAILTAVKPVEVDREQVKLGAGTRNFLNRVKKPKKGAISIGLPDIDRAWDGGYRPGEIGMVVAPTGVGKSMFLSYMAAQAWWQNADVLYYTFELTPEQIRDRIALAALQKGKNDTHGTWDEEVNRAFKQHGLTAPPTAEIDIRGGSMTWPGVVADLEEFHRDKGKYPDVLLLDAADDIAPIGRYAKEHESLKAAYVFMRALAYDKKMRIWSTGQLNRESVERSRINLRYIGDAFAKAQKSHYVIGLSNASEGPETYAGNRMNIYILKDSLHGSTGGWLECATDFGDGNNGFPGFSVDKIHKLAVM